MQKDMDSEKLENAQTKVVPEPRTEPTTATQAPSEASAHDKLESVAASEHSNSTKEASNTTVDKKEKAEEMSRPQNEAAVAEGTTTKGTEQFSAREGNDQVTADPPPNKPLVPTTVSVSALQKAGDEVKDPTWTVANKSNESKSEKGAKCEKGTTDSSSTAPASTTVAVPVVAETGAVATLAANRTEYVEKQGKPAAGPIPAPHKPPPTPASGMSQSVSPVFAPPQNHASQTSVPKTAPQISAPLQPPTVPPKPAPPLHPPTAPLPASAMAPINDPEAVQKPLGPTNFLAEAYAPFVQPEDTSINAARQRLHKALQQTYQLRKAFTERVYGKYRVCLRPPQPPLEVQAQLQKDPAGMYQRLAEEIAVVQEEKEMEKKHAVRLTAEVAALQQQSQGAATASPATVAAARMWGQGIVDHADQLMYLSAGLNMVILPEEEASEADLRTYTDRAPINHETGQRVKNISHAAATAGNVMLERKRRALGLREDRLRNRQLLTGGSGAGTPAAPARFPSIEPLNISAEKRPAPMTTAPLPSIQQPAAASAVRFGPQTTIPAKPRGSVTQRESSTAPTTSGKASRSRGSAGLTASALLSVVPSAEEIVRNPQDAKSWSPATLALMARVVKTGANSSRTMQQRLRHPHPESLGGRRRAGVQANMSSSVSPEPFLQSYLANTLPPLPAAKERLERKPVSVFEPEEATSQRARKSIRNILSHLVPQQKDAALCETTKIKLLYELHRLSIGSKDESKPKSASASEATNETDGDKEPPKEKESSQQQNECDSETALDPILTFSVLNAVGLFGRAPSSDSGEDSFSLPEIEEGHSALWSPKLKSLHDSLVTSTQRFTTSMIPTRKRQRESTKGSEAKESENDEKRQKVEVPEVGIIPVENIRGGGESAPEGGDDNGVPDRAGGGNSSKPSQATRKGSEDSGNARSTSSNAASPSRSAARSANSQRMPPVAGPPQHMPMGIQEYPPLGDRYPPNATLSVMHLANSLQQQMHHPAGDLADYLGTLQHHPGYELSSLMSSGQPPGMSHLANLGPLAGAGMVGYSLQERAATARAILAQREQQAASLLGGAAPHGYQQPGQAAFHHVGAHPAAVSALLGQQNANFFSRGQMGMPHNGRQSSSSLSQPVQQHGHGQTMSRSRSGSKSSDKSLPQQQNGGQSKSTATNAGAQGRTDAVSRKPAPQQQKENPAESKPVSSKEDDTESKQATDTGAEKKESARKEIVGEQEKATVDKQVVAPGSSLTTKSDSKDAPLPQPDEKNEDSGMKFLSPNKPASVTPAEAELIRAGHFHQVIHSLSDLFKGTHYLDYLQEVGGAVPIPKALVLNALKERLNAPAFKNVGGPGAPPMSREGATAAILVWLWAKHEKIFQLAFDKSGRIDVDPDCKWLIQTAVDTAVQELKADIADSMAKGEGVFAEASAARKGNPHIKASKPARGTSEFDRARATKKLHVHIASVVSKSLMVRVRINPFVDVAIPEFESLSAYLDESRLGALRAKSQERVLLANLLARRTTFSESFSHAYVSAMVRAGEALGHGKLFEIAQNEEALVSTMIPYDVFTDETGQWEDPCKTEEGFSEGLAGADLFRRAHAKAMIQKSLRKLQDRHNIKGGATSYGPYTDGNEKDAPRRSQGSSDGASASSRPSLKRRYSSISEPPAPPGTGSAKATSWTLYDPKHFSEPLQWSPRYLENQPYGRYRRGERSRSLSLSLSARSGEPRSSKKAKRSMSFSAPQQETIVDLSEGIPRSTHEIDWGDVASIFQMVELPRKSPSRASKADHAHGVPPPDGGIIFAPFCGKFDGVYPSDQGEEDESDEDTNEETVLANHQLVLDDMKAKLTAFLDTRKKANERRKSKYSKK